MENVSVNSWVTMPKEQRQKIILQLQRENNSLKTVIDQNQKKLVDMRCAVPEECREMFEEEKKTLLKHYTTAELFPALPNEGFGPEETQRMTNTIKDRIEATLADCKETRRILAANEQIEAKNELLRSQITSLGESLLEKLRR